VVSIRAQAVTADRTNRPPEAPGSYRNRVGRQAGLLVVRCQTL
jgi:hypothetical protein